MAQLEQTTPMPYQLIYSSHASTPMPVDELEDILEHAQGSNATEGITGALVYADGHFLQVLEGEQRAVEQLMRRIAKDLRHETIVVLQAGDVPVAAFPKWEMAYVSATPEQIARWAGLSGTHDLTDVWEDLRHNPQRTEQVARSILSVLKGSLAL